MSSKFLSTTIRYRAFAPLIVFFILIISFYFVTKGRFFDPLSINSILSTAPEWGILSIGVSLLMISGEFDLSVGSVFTLCTLIYAILWLKMGVDPLLSLVMILILGAVLGLINGIVTLYIGIPSIITTLGTMYLWRGIALVICGGLPISYRGETRPFKDLLTGEIIGIPVQIIWFLAIAIVLEIILYWHKFGNQVMATGDNETAAKEMGINTKRIKLVCFTIVGILVAFSAVMESTRIGEGSARLGIGYEFYAIASSVIGGTSLYGGTGTLIGTFFGVLIIQSIGTGLAVMGISGYWINVLIGLIIIIIMGLNILVAKRGRRF